MTLNNFLIDLFWQLNQMLFVFFWQQLINFQFLYRKCLSLTLNNLSWIFYNSKWWFMLKPASKYNQWILVIFIDKKLAQYLSFMPKIYLAVWMRFNYYFFLFKRICVFSDQELSAKTFLVKSIMVELWSQSTKIWWKFRKIMKWNWNLYFFVFSGKNVIERSNQKLVDLLE